MPAFSEQKCGWRCDECGGEEVAFDDSLSPPNGQAAWVDGVPQDWLEIRGGMRRVEGLGVRAKDKTYCPDPICREAFLSEAQARAAS